MLIGSLVGLLVILGGGAAYLFTRDTKPETPLSTYFTYTSDDLASLKGLKPTQDIAVADLTKSEADIYSLISKNKIGDVDASRIYAYLFTAQRDAAYISYNERGKMQGDLEAISDKVVCLFIESACSDTATDPYSEALAKLVTAKASARIAEDRAMTKPYAHLVGAQYWSSSDPLIGEDAGSRKPWFIKAGNQFRVVPAPTDAASVAEQLAETKAALAAITPDQTKAVIFWAGGPGTKTPPGLWLEIASTYMGKKNTALEKRLQARSDLSMVMADAVIAVFDSKYTYWQKRPFMLDPTIITVMPTPNHPSYPAGHATISSAAATMLTHHFPENSAEWDSLKKEAGNSRTWGGIHFPIDNETGFTLGKQVADEAILQVPQ